MDKLKPLGGVQGCFEELWFSSGVFLSVPSQAVTVIVQWKCAKKQ